MAKVNKRVSVVWDHFVDVGGLYATCNICKVKLSFKSSVTNLKKHMDKKHPTVRFNSRNGKTTINQLFSSHVHAFSGTSDELPAQSTRAPSPQSFSDSLLQPMYEECVYTDKTETETETKRENGKDADDLFIEHSYTPPTTKMTKNSQDWSTNSKLKEIKVITNSTTDESEFDVFGKHVALQLKSLPILMALEAQEHIQLYMNRIRRRYLMDNAEL